MSEYDVVVDGADNFDVRYALSDASVLTGTPVVYGSVFRFEGQVTVFDPGAGFTYRGFMPDPPPPEVAPNCSTAGVLGVLPGIIGTIQATETIKLLLGIGNPLVGRMLIVDALEMDTTELKLTPGATRRRRQLPNAVGADTKSLRDRHIRAGQITIGPQALRAKGRRCLH